VACSVTIRTDQRRHWGRFYLPSLGQAVLDSTTGRISTAFADQVAAAAVLLTDRSNTSLGHPTLTVWSRTGGTHHDPQSVAVDDVPDVIRSRRFKKPIYKKILAAG
jgi:hypothetical protein